MLDRFNRNINYLRISVTDRCDLRCTYCVPEEGIKWIKHSEVLSFEEITEVVKAAVGMGVDKIRLTGGEPLVRKGIVELVRMIAETPGLKELAMTTNAQKLDEFAIALAKAGLQRVNVSLDTLDEQKYSELTRGGNIKRVMAGLKAAENAGLTPIKINCVIHESTTEVDKQSLKTFCKENDYRLRFIRQMSLQDGTFYPVEGGTGGQCSICNRVRLTAIGDLKPCLFSDHGYNVRKYGAEEALRMAVGKKPKAGHKNKMNHFYNIGG